MTTEASKIITQIKDVNRQAHGTEHYHRWSVLFPKYVMTDGVKQICDIGGLYWFADIIGSHQTKAKVREQDFQVWRLQPTKSEDAQNDAVVVCEDGNGKVITRQNIPMTDFPVAQYAIEFWFVRNDDYMVLLLKTEY